MTYDRLKLEAELVRDEGERLLVYRCTAGKRTVGVGRNLDDVGISAEEIRSLGTTKASAIAKGIPHGFGTTGPYVVVAAQAFAKGEATATPIPLDSIDGTNVRFSGAPPGSPVRAWLRINKDAPAW